MIGADHGNAREFSVRARERTQRHTAHAGDCLEHLLQLVQAGEKSLRVLLGRRQAVVSTNDIKADVSQLADRALAMARAASEDPFAGLADSGMLARDIPDLDLLDPELPSVSTLEARARSAEAAALEIKGVAKSGGASASAGIGGMVLVTSAGFRGAYLSSGQSISMTAIAGEGTAMERDYDYSSALHGSDLESPEKVGRTAGERAVARLNPRKVETKRVPVIFDRCDQCLLVGIRQMCCRVVTQQDHAEVPQPGLHFSAAERLTGVHPRNTKCRAERTFHVVGVGSFAEEQQLRISSHNS